MEGFNRILLVLYPFSMKKRCRSNEDDDQLISIFLWLLGNVHVSLRISRLEPGCLRGSTD